MARSSATAVARFTGPHYGGRQSDDFHRRRVPTSRASPDVRVATMRAKMHAAIASSHLTADSDPAAGHRLQSPATRLKAPVSRLRATTPTTSTISRSEYGGRVGHGGDHVPDLAVAA